MSDFLCGELTLKQSETQELSDSLAWRLISSAADRSLYLQIEPCIAQNIHEFLDFDRRRNNRPTTAFFLTDSPIANTSEGLIEPHICASGAGWDFVEFEQRLLNIQVWTDEVLDMSEVESCSLTFTGGWAGPFKKAICRESGWVAACLAICHEEEGTIPNIRILMR